MTKVQLKRVGTAYLVRSEGHATGSAEVCAAVSALMQALEGWLQAEKAVVIHEMRMEPGDCELCFSGDCEQAFSLICVGFLRLQATAPELVQAEIEES